MEKKCVYCGAPLPGDASFCHCCARSQQEKRLFLPPRRRRRIRWSLWAAAVAALLAIACVPILRGQAAPSDLLPAGQPTALPEAAASTAPQTVPIPETTVPEETLTQLQELALNAIEEALATPDLETHTPQLVNAIEYRSGNWDGKRSTFHGLLLRLEGNFLLEDEYDSHLNVLLDMDTGEILNSTQLDYDRIRAYQRTVANREQYHHLLLNAYRSFLEDDLLQIWMDSEIRDELPQEDLDAVNSRLALDFPEEEAEMGFGFPGEIPLPVQSCSFEEGALIEPIAVGMHAVRERDVSIGQNILIIGAGTIGLGVYLSAKICNPSKIIVADVVDYNLEMARELGCEYTINSMKEDLEAEVKKLTNGEGVDITFLAFGNAPVVESASKCTKEGGVISEIAVIPNGTGCPYNMIQVKQQSLIGSNMYVRKDYEVVVENMAKGRIDSKKMVSKIYPIEEFTAAMEMADKRTEPVVKVMLKF